MMLLWYVLSTRNPQNYVKTYHDFIFKDLFLVDINSGLVKSVATSVACLDYLNFLGRVYP